MKTGFPYAIAGQTVGLLGGSFDPPHRAHVHISHEALKRFGLDRLWWLVSPGNPLKQDPPAPLPDRINAARAMISDPRITVTGIEAEIGTHHTAQTIARLQKLYPGVRFVWIMGADNLQQFDRWKDWRDIMERVPVGVLARPDERTSARNARAATIYRDSRRPPHDARALARSFPPAWVLVNIPMIDLSSTQLRGESESR